MNEIDQLQHALSQLEAGAPVDPMAKDMPAETAELLRLAARLQAAPPATAGLRAQRERVLRAARPSPAPRRGWLWPAALASGLVGLAMCALLVGAGAFGAWWWSAGQTVVTASQVPPAGITAAAAALTQVRGRVEVRAVSGAWRPAQLGEALADGTAVRTGALSSASVAFADGSRANLGPNSELALEVVEASARGRGVIRLRQTAGVAEHTVAKATRPGAQYLVLTPTGAGLALGTAFRVEVLVGQRATFTVTEGVVAVTHLEVTVSVTAGQSTLVEAGAPPAPPALYVNGEGQVLELGAVWRIGAQSLAVTPETVINGAPALGDWVAFAGRQLADGTRVADQITLVRRAIDQDFVFVGTVDAIGPTAWTISGRTVLVTATTEIAPGLAVGDTVEVTGRLTAAGAFEAGVIRALAAVETFRLIGVVEAIGAAEWTVSGLTFTVGASTTIEAGVLVSDTVEVRGLVQADGTRLAESITRIAPPVEGVFDFVGIVITTAPWNVSGVPLLTDADTLIDEGLRTGNRVRVTGRILADGQYLAEAIQQLDEGRRHAVQFTARIEQIDPWVIGGVSVTVEAKTRLAPNLAVGERVHVKGNLLPDGTVLAKSITRLSAGCATLSGVVVAVSAEAITLVDGQTLPLTGTVSISGTLEVRAVIEIEACAGEGGEVVIVSITVLYVLEALPPTATPTPTATVGPTPTAGTPAAGGKVTLCHKPDNKKGGNTLTVDQAAVPSHLAHGDTLGPCP